MAVFHLATGRVVYEMAVVLTREERHLEFAVRRVLGTDKESKAESADCESPGRSVVGAPMADQPSVAARINRCFCVHA